MLDLHRPPSSTPKIHFTHSQLPTYIDPCHPPTKKFPFAAMHRQPFSHVLTLLLPSPLYALARPTLARSFYVRVHMTLAEILDREFLDAYVRKGNRNIAMLAQGGDNWFEVRGGVLGMELERCVYERCGVQGVVVSGGGRKHAKERWRVTCDLTAAQGGKALERMRWACANVNVLDQRLTWLVWNALGSREDVCEGLCGFAPCIRDMEPVAEQLPERLVPRLKGLQGLYDDEVSGALREYLSLAALNSPRIAANDNIDPALSRYEMPDLGAGRATRDMVCVRWKGLVTPEFAREVFLGVGAAVLKGRGRDADGGGDVEREGEEEEEMKWFSISATAFGGRKEWSVLQCEGRQTATWECED